jgi:hypothetical protein
MLLHRWSYPVQILLLFIAGCQAVNAQSRVLNGLILDKITGRGVVSALVLNYSTRIDAYSDSNGIFNLEVSFGDTILLSAVGYYYNRLVVNDSLLDASVPVKFTFTPRVYEITEARIIGLGSYNDFKNSFVEMQRSKTKIDILIENLGSISKIEGKDAYDRALATGRLEPPRLGVPIRSPEEKERIALKKIMEKEQIKEQIYLKFNPDVIKKVTGLTDDRDILEFMTFCDFSDEYLLEISEYDLAAQIVLRFEEYKSRRVNIF